jgi:hypothetical protein
MSRTGREGFDVTAGVNRRPAGYRSPMAYEEPVSYLTLRKGAPVRSSDDVEVGVVAHVLADPDADIFDGLVVEARSGHRFVDASEVAGMDAQGVTLAIDSQAAQRLPEPAENPATMETGPDDTVPATTRDRLQRAWDLISGKG